jgi:hypothetical protein
LLPLRVRQAHADTVPYLHRYVTSFEIGNGSRFEILADESRTGAR